MEQNHVIYMYGEYKEVYFDKYCHLCEFYEGSEDEDPCFECLQNGAKERGF